VHEGDCVQIMRECVADRSVQLIVTSPPYGADKEYDVVRTKEQYMQFTVEWMTQASRVLKPGCSVFVNIGYWCGSRKSRWFMPGVVIAAAEQCDLTHCGWINWVKDKHGAYSPLLLGNR
jgi:DNA modification methylase